ncbi:exosortase N [Chitinophaga nivalis]|uniref:Exosortase N n=1 Tax=Chitinophaga nivalis TaxID=2991709 RepID=A0ABT3IHF3_9BACT|nr:exosortase N [Chitinophaga nivalis]MCW3466935.1 exosortase N [Chitinophaga nivalis]MCW3483374.1 exosortase N [Chitinophaga nivalis]
MLTLPAIRKKINTGKWLSAGWLLLYIVLACWQLQHYFAWRTAAFLLALITLFTVVRIDNTVKGSSRCGYVAIVLLLLTWQLPVMTLKYATLAAAVFFVIEYGYGRLNRLTFITAILITPAMDYAAGIFSFPLRLWLTGIAGKILSLLNGAVTTSGNMILLHNEEFSVDTACMGLQLLTVSFLCAVMLVGWYERRYQQQLPLYLLAALLAGVLLLNILANLSRIVCLVQFGYPPATMAHELMGILSLLFYVILPLLAGTGWLVKRYGQISRATPVKHPGYKRGYILQGIIGIGVVLVCCKTPAVATDSHASPLRVNTLPEYTTTLLSEGITKMVATHSLVYVKPVPGFYFTDHQPMICWKGSGFDFQQVKEEKKYGVTMYTGLLRKENSTLYTAWWYDNGYRKSCSQLEWRWDALRNGHPYFLVNITADNPAILDKKIEALLQAKLIPGMP